MRLADFTFAFPALLLAIMLTAVFGPGMVNAIIAGLLSPLLSHRGLHLALGAAAFSVVAWLVWRWELSRGPHALRASPDAPALEPTDEL